MLNNITIGRYIHADSILHKSNSIVKLLVLITYIILLFNAKGFILLVLASLIPILLIIMSKTKLILYLRSVYALRFLMLSLLVINLFIYKEVNSSIEPIIRLIDIVIMSTLVSVTTKTEDLIDGLTVLFKPFNFFFNVDELACILAYSIKFIPVLLDYSSENLKAQYVYSHKYSRLQYLKWVIVPIIMNAFINLDIVVKKMEIKGNDLSIVEHTKNKLKKEDLLLVSFNIGLLILIIIKEVV